MLGVLVSLFSAATGYTKKAKDFGRIFQYYLQWLEMRRKWENRLLKKKERSGRAIFFQQNSLCKIKMKNLRKIFHFFKEKSVNGENLCPLEAEFGHKNLNCGRFS